MTKHIEELQRQLEQAKGKAGQLRGSLGEAERRVASLQVEIAEAEHGYKEGDPVWIVARAYSRVDDARKPAFFAGWMAGYRARPAYRIEKKDGSPGKDVRDCHIDSIEPREVES